MMLWKDPLNIKIDQAKQIWTEWTTYKVLRATFHKKWIQKINFTQNSVTRTHHELGQK